MDAVGAGGLRVETRFDRDVLSFNLHLSCAIGEVMPPKLREINLARPRTHGVRPRCIQTSRCTSSGFHKVPIRSPFDVGRTVFRLPNELIVEVVTCFGDPHHNILSVKSTRGESASLYPEHVERLTAIRKLTMTCWHLRNMLFPLLWKYVEGCNVHCRRLMPLRPGSKRVIQVGNGLYDQCVYLVLNPIIGAYVQCVYSLIHEWRLTGCHFSGLSLWI